MKLDFSWEALAQAAGGRLLSGEGTDKVCEIGTDSRTIKPAQAFWALVGEHFDAHKFLDENFARRCSGWIVANDRIPDSAKPAHLVGVADTLKALQALARHHRLRFEIPVVAIGGSNGKTTTKEMLRSICALVGPTCSTPGNWNNEIGVPLSVLELTSDHRYAVFEVAARRRGEIAELSRIVSPTIALLTNIGPDHLETFGSIETTFQTNSELIENLGEDGLAVINADDPWLAALEQRLGPRAVTFGRGTRCRVRVCDDDSFIVDRHRVAVKMQSFGEFNRYNAAAAAAAACAMGIDPDTIRRGLEAYAPGMLRQESRRNERGATLVVDAYNANPTSMRASIEAFLEKYRTKRKILVLGDMKELGQESSRFHRELGEWLARQELASVLLAGPEMRAAATELERAHPRFEVRHSDDPAALSALLRGPYGPDDALLFKGSRAMQMEKLATGL